MKIFIKNLGVCGNMNSLSDKITYSVDRVIGCDCPAKYLVTLNHQFLCFANSKGTASNVISYIFTGDEQICKNGNVKKRVKQILAMSVKQIA